MVSASQCGVATGKNQPGVVADDQAGHSLLRDKVLLEPLYGCPIQLMLLQWMVATDETSERTWLVGFIRDELVSCKPKIVVCLPRQGAAGRHCKASHVQAQASSSIHRRAHPLFRSDGHRRIRPRSVGPGFSISERWLKPCLSQSVRDLRPDCGATFHIPAAIKSRMDKLASSPWSACSTMTHRS